MKGDKHGVRAILAHLIKADRNHQTQAAQMHPAAKLNHTGPPSAFGAILWYISCLAAISPSVIYQNNVILTFPLSPSSGTLSHFTGNEETHLCLLRQRTHHKSQTLQLKRILLLGINPNCASEMLIILGLLGKALSERSSLWTFKQLLLVTERSFDSTWCYWYSLTL